MFSMFSTVGAGGSFVRSGAARIWWRSPPPPPRSAGINSGHLRILLSRTHSSSLIMRIMVSAHQTVPPLKRFLETI